ncbi:MAG TPA: cytochrome C oxidase subunit IV family protein [Ilumatobacter sp.]|nr:cytochrome C oxidase subunit IV family protein [Ilumatobacter sp.]
MTETLTGAEHAHDEHDAHDDHWSDLKYVKLALALAVVTAVEVALSYMVDDLGVAFLPLLLGLMLVKFFAVVMYFMHLKFDNKLFSVFFYTGMILAFGVYLGVMLTYKFFNS